MPRMRKEDSEWKIEKTDTNVARFSTHMSMSAPKRLLFLADVHWDSAHCRLDLLKKTMDEAKQDNTPVFIFGDLFDAMQGKWDPRSSQDTLRDEHRGGNYLDLLVDTAVEWFTPYKDILALISYGNHETSIMKRHEVDLIQRLVGALRSKKSQVLVGPYWGFILMAITCRRYRESADVIKRISWHHGYGGGGEVTRGMIDSSRTRSMYDADVYVSGHIHRRNFDENVMTRVSSKGTAYNTQQLFLRCSSWKEETSGYHVEKGRAARPLGGWWINYEYHRNSLNDKYDIIIKPVQT